jgi:hypothetical protein
VSKNNKNIKKSDSKQSLEEIVSLIELVSKELEKEPNQISVTDLKGFVSERQLKNHGGLPLIKKAHFPETEKDLASINKLKLTSKYIQKLEINKGKVDAFKEELIKAIDNLQLKIPKIKSIKVKKSSKDKVEVVAMLNDNHIGLIVDPEEVGNINSFDFKEAGRRVALYVKEVCSYKRYKRSSVSRLNLVFAGDNLAGLIHSLDTKSVHLMIHQLNGMFHIYTHAISLLLQEFPEIVVYGLPGNHSRAVHKNGGNRAVVETYDSYENILFYGLSVAFRANKNIKFDIPKTPYAFINLPAGRCMVVHGDHIFSKYLGNPGTSINVKSLSGAIKDFNAGEISKGNTPVKLILFAHVHTFAHFITNDGVEVYISPSLVGLDQYAHSLTINNNFIAQPVFESTNKFILADSRLIRLNGADLDKSLDELIPIYKKELKWNSQK